MPLLSYFSLALLSTSALSALVARDQTSVSMARPNVTNAKYDGVCFYPAPTEDFNLHEYLGTWYEVAGYQQGFLQGCACITATYTANPNGTVNVLNNCLRGGQPAPIRGLASPVDERYTRGSSGAFTVTFPGFPPDKQCPGPNYVVQKQCDDWAIVQSSNFSGLFLLSRQRQPSESSVKRWIDEAVKRGSDPKQIVRFDTSGCV